MCLILEILFVKKIYFILDILFSKITIKSKRIKRNSMQKIICNKIGLCIKLDIKFHISHTHANINGLTNNSNPPVNQTLLENYSSQI